MARVDDELEDLCRLIDGKGKSLSLTVMVGGMVVSGDLISDDAYFEDLGAQYVAGYGAPPDEAVVDMAQEFRERGQAAMEGHRERERRQADLVDEIQRTGVRPPREELEALDREFIHMRNAWIYGTGAHPLRVRLWRGRADAVVGWSLQSLRPTDVET